MKCPCAKQTKNKCKLQYAVIAKSICGVFIIGMSFLSTSVWNLKGQLVLDLLQLCNNTLESIRRHCEGWATSKPCQFALSGS